MLTYLTLQDRPREFLAATGLTADEFARLLPAFAAAYAVLYPPEKTWEGKRRQRQRGGGAKGGLPQMEDKLLFILVYQKTHPLQTMHGLQFALRQPQTHYWIHRLLPVLQRALVALDMAPEREASRVATSPLALEGTPALAIDGTERRRQRPGDAVTQQQHYSGKKKTHTDKNLLLVNEMTGTVVYLGPTEPGKKHDKKAADEAQIVYPPHATLDKDTGFQGYEPPEVLTQQPKKKRQARKGV
jgi:DDE superfamily endonuclease